MDLKTSPKDKFFIVQIIFFVLGLGTLLPWNFFINSIPYFEDRLSGNISASRNGTEPIADHWRFANWMTLLAMLPLLLFTCLNSILYPRVPQNARIAGSLFGILILFMLTTVLVKITMEPLAFFMTTMATIWFINSFGAVLQGSLFGLIGLLPAKYSSVFMSGQGVAGIFAALAAILAKISGVSKEATALGYFITPCLVIFLTIILYFILPRLEFAKYHFAKSQQMPPTKESNTELLSSDENKSKEKIKGEASLISLEDGQDKVEKTSSLLKVFSKIWMTAISTCLVFTVTLSVFPAITAKVSSQMEEGQWKEYFTPVACFLLFNIMDWLGRSITAVYMWPRRRVPLLVMVLLRVAFIPLFVFCNVKERLHGFTVFQHDGWYILFMILFAFSNGYLVTLCMCYAPKQVSTRDAETAGAIMAFFLSLGLALGAALSFAIRMMI
ncbi:equilibrative nucleoside transporter 2-like [Mobula hypostoma]|uniref:equilibrative nucleoside transporter 2-like n=1 Tax=Mobula hypostoma TaxID=723540 RepID=UPI002FC2D64D